MEGEIPDYNKLLSFEPNQNYLTLMRNILTGVSEDVDEDTQLNIITDLRRVLKFQRDLFTTIFTNIVHQFVSKCLKSQTRLVAVSSLKLVTEIFSMFDFDLPDQWNIWLPVLIEEVLVCSLNEEIHKEACEALNNLACNMLYPVTLETLFSLMSEEQLGANASETILMMITYLDDMTLINMFDWNEIYNIICAKYNSEDKIYTKRVANILQRIKEKLRGLYDDYIKVLTPENLNLHEVLIAFV